MTEKNMPLWEVFIRSRTGLAHRHVGSVHAADAEMALQNARDVYTRRGEGLSVWVVPSPAITASDPADKDTLVRADRVENLPASDLLRGAGRSRAYVTLFPSPRESGERVASDKVASRVRGEPRDLPLTRLPRFTRKSTSPRKRGEVKEDEMTETPLFAYTLRLADNALILGHRVSEWVGHAPVLEEDLALGNLALDLIGQSRSFYTYAGEIEGKGRDEDALAYLRDAGGYRNVLLVEQPNGDFAQTIVRHLLYSAYAHPYFEALTRSKDATLAAIAAKAVKEMAYHVRHTAEWTIRLGDGTDESHRRTQTALDELWPYTGELFEIDQVERALIEAGIAVNPSDIRTRWSKTLDEVFEDATLTRPRDGYMQSGGRSGRHSEHLGFILTELQYLQRSHPGAKW